MVCKWFDLCPLRMHEADGRIDGSFRKEYCESETKWETCERYILEEKGFPHSDELLPDGTSLDD